MQVHELVASFGRAGESANPMIAARDILVNVRTCGSINNDRSSP